MGLSLVLNSVATDYRRHAAVYRSVAAEDLRLRGYPEPAALLTALGPTSGLSVQAKSELVLALARQQAHAPHALWLALLLRTFAPMLLRIERAVRGADAQELPQQILAAFLQAVADVGRSPRPGAVLLELRSRTRRPLFRELRHQQEERRCTRRFTDAVDPRTGLEELLDVERSAHADLVCTLAHGDLRGALRAEHPTASDEEFERLYRRTQRRRHRLVQKLRASDRAERRDTCPTAFDVPSCTPARTA